MTHEKNVFTMKWPSLIAKNGKKICVSEEKSLIGLTPAFDVKATKP